MIKISIMYPATKGAVFDMKYYVETHMPMSIKLVNGHPGYRSVSVERGIGGIEPGSEPAYVAMTHYVFNTIEDFWEANKPHGETLQNDMVHCTNITPVIQFSEVELAEQR